MKEKKCLGGEKEKKDVTNVDTHTDRQTDTQTEKGVNPTSRYSTGFSIVKIKKMRPNKGASKDKHVSAA